MPKITILYGARDKEPTYHEELDKLLVRYPRLELHYIKEPQRINPDIIQEYVNDIKKSHFYISGPEPMVEAFDKMLQEMGVPEDNLRKDYFPGYAW
jgi:ferredoxin-NADP reductase